MGGGETRQIKLHVNTYNQIVWHLPVMNTRLESTVILRVSIGYLNTVIHILLSEAWNTLKWKHVHNVMHMHQSKQVTMMLLFLLLFVQPMFHDWCTKSRGMCYPVCGMVHIKEPLLLIEKSSPCDGSGFPLSLCEWSFTICLTPYNRK